MKIKVDNSKCLQNHLCLSVRVCPVNAINQVGHNAPTVLEHKCIKCGKCIRYCPMGAINFIEE